MELIRRLDPRPGQRYNQSETRLIEPDVAFVKRDDEYVVVMNEEDLPALRLNSGYRQDAAGEEDRARSPRVREGAVQVGDPVASKYRAAQEHDHSDVGEAIVRRQGGFSGARRGCALRPMMIKEVAEEIGVHPSTVSRAVANKYVHTTQGVYELRFFFSEGVGGPEGGDLPLPAAEASGCGS